MDLHVVITVLIFASVKTVLSKQSEYEQNRPVPSLMQNYEQRASFNNDRASNFEKYDSKSYDERVNVASDSNDILSNDDDDWSTVPGTAGKDYPNYRTIPQTSFTCADKKPGGYYADMETGCQVFHVCNARGVKSSFLCSPGSIFNQKYFVCDWWYDVECDNASDLYSLNDQLNRGEVGVDPSGPDPNYIDNHKYHGKESRDGFNSIDLSLASSGFDVSDYPKNRTSDLPKGIANRKQELANFTWQSIDSSNHRESARKGNDINYLSAVAKDWQIPGDTGAQSINEKTRPTFADEHLVFHENRPDPAKKAVLNERRVLDNVPRGFSKGDLQNKHSNYYSGSNTDFFYQNQDNFQRLPQNDQYQYQNNYEEMRYNNYPHQANFEDNRKNVIFDQREQTNFVRPFVQNRKEDIYNRLPEEFIKPPALNQNSELFNYQHEHFARPNNGRFENQRHDHFNINFVNDKNINNNNNKDNNNNKNNDNNAQDNAQSNQEDVNRQVSRAGIIYADSNSEDDFERRRQKEIDDAMLCKNRNGNNGVNNQANIHESNGKVFDDVEANRLTYEKPPHTSESFYSQYNKLHTQSQKSDEFGRPPFPPDQAFASPTNDEKTSSSGNHERNNNSLLKSRIRPTGGLRNGLGNGFPSSNRELVGSNTIAGISGRKLSLGQHPDYRPLGNQHVSQFGLDVNSLSH